MREIEGKKKLTRKDNELIGSGDLAMYRENVRTIMTRIRDSYAEQLVTRTQVDYRELAMNMVGFIKLEASKMVYRVTNRVAKKHAIDLMEEVGIPEARKRYYQYPFQFSGGMRQRIVIAIALSANPDILICDEPTTALDVTIQAQILDLINGLKKERQLSVIFITHDLGVVANMADQIAVMYAGKVVEYGTVDEVFYEPAHPYTWALLASMPDLDTKEKLGAIPGTPPNMIYPPKGDAFAARNKYALAIDFEEEPPFFDITPTHRAATWLLHPSAPKAELPRIVSERIKRMRGMEVNVDE
jgi:oligopeptide/dipeptide ABC transporter ATP-binding protein